MAGVAPGTGVAAGTAGTGVALVAGDWVAGGRGVTWFAVGGVDPFVPLPVALGAPLVPLDAPEPPEPPDAAEPEPPEPLDPEPEDAAPEDPDPEPEDPEPEDPEPENPEP